MSKRAQVALIAVVCFLLGGVVSQHLPFAQAQETKKPSWLHGLDLKVRKGGEANFDKNTKVYGIEVFKDENNGNLIYISESGSIAVVPGK
jgi:hypothetical protein